VIDIPSDVWQSMVEHARGEYPNEACGMLAGGEGRIEHFFAMRNADASPGSYRLDSKEQFAVTNEIEEKGWDLLGIVHSHTHSEAYPSETDRRQALPVQFFYPDAQYVLISLQDRAEPVVRAFTIRDGEIAEQKVRIT
jgi:[CysO sulfur-carrier protein]-S-L-cysteine hydrolase